ncbi:MAG: trypsin-like peptidase domain-containing protein [Verrucomicrobiota bacterium]
MTPIIHIKSLLFALVLTWAITLQTAKSQDSSSQVDAAVVKIINYSQKNDWYSPWQSRNVRSGSGSGFVIEGNRIMTNAHVVADSRKLLIFFEKDPKPYPAKAEFIAHDCDLAIIVPENMERLKAIKPLEIGELPNIRSQVTTHGYPAGGNRISTTIGVVSRIEINTYIHSGVDTHLSVQTDAAINPGNSGGPVTKDGKVVGVAFQGNPNLQNTGFFIPPQVVNHFLQDISDGTHDGFPKLAITTDNMQNPFARSYAGMKKEDSGVRVNIVKKGGIADGHLQRGDILLEADGYNIANDGTILWNDLRLQASFLLDLHQKSQSLSLRVLRDGDHLDLDIPLARKNPQRLQRVPHNEAPKYYIYGGLVFVPLTRGALMTYGDKWQQKADSELIYEAYYRPIEENYPLDRGKIILLRRLDHEVNNRISWYQNEVIKTVNGKAVYTLEDLVEAIESHQGPQHFIDFEYAGKSLALDRELADTSGQEILKRYGINSDRRL